MLVWTGNGSAFARIRSRDLFSRLYALRSWGLRFAAGEATKLVRRVGQQLEFRRVERYGPARQTQCLAGVSEGPRGHTRVEVESVVPQGRQLLVGSRERGGRCCWTHMWRGSPLCFECLNPCGKLPSVGLTAAAKDTFVFFFRLAHEKAFSSCLLQHTQRTQCT